MIGVTRSVHQAGDTIVEVLLAIVIISVVIAGAYQTTNRGLRIEQNAIERTQASEITAQQAEALRTIRDLKSTNPNAATTWTSIMSNVRTTVPDYNTCSNTTNAATTGSSPFYLNTGSTPVALASGRATSSQLTYWVEAYRPSASDTYVDFHVRGCWQGIGEGGRQKISVVLRLNSN